VAINVTVATSGTGLTTASFTRTTGRLYIAYVFAYSFSATVGTTSLTDWDNMGTAGGEPFNSNVCRIQALRFVPGSDATSALTFTNTNTGVGFSHVILEITGHDPSGTNGSGAIVQVVDSNTTGNDPNNYNLTLAALGDAVNNVVVAGFANAGTGAATPSAGYTELADVGAGAAALSVNWRLPGTTTPGTSNSNAFADIGGIGIEIKVDAGGAATRGTPFGHRGTAFNGGRSFNGILQRSLWLPQRHSQFALARTMPSANAFGRYSNWRRGLSTTRAGRRQTTLPGRCTRARS
jgi:hypothetical protein